MPSEQSLDVLRDATLLINVTNNACMATPRHAQPCKSRRMRALKRPLPDSRGQ